MLIQSLGVPTGTRHFHESPALLNRAAPSAEACYGRGSAKQRTAPPRSYCCCNPSPDERSRFSVVVELLWGPSQRREASYEIRYTLAVCISTFKPALEQDECARCLTSSESNTQELPVSFRVQARFEDVFKIRGPRPKKIGKEQRTRWDNGVLSFNYDGADGILRSLEVHFDPRPKKTSSNEIRASI